MKDWSVNKRGRPVMAQCATMRERGGKMAYRRSNVISWWVVRLVMVVRVLW